MTKPEGTDGKKDPIRHDNSISLVERIIILHEEELKIKQKNKQIGKIITPRQQHPEKSIENDSMMQKSEFQELYLHLSFTKACYAILIELMRLQ